MKVQAEFRFHQRKLYFFNTILNLKKLDDLGLLNTARPSEQVARIFLLFDLSYMFYIFTFIYEHVYVQQNKLLGDLVG